MLPHPARSAVGRLAVASAAAAALAATPAVGLTATPTVGGAETTSVTAVPPPITTISGVVEYAAGDPAFYAAPDPLPALEHGTLLRFQLADPTFGSAWRIMYASTDAAGAPTVATALVNNPGDAAIGAESFRAPIGGFPVLVYAHETIGFADQCAPSSTYGVFGDRYASGFEAIQRSDRWVVVAPDLEGIGSPGAHPYLIGASGGRSLLDAAAAARQLPGFHTSDTTALLGVEAGGHAALWAAQLAGEWSPTQRIAGVVVGGTGADPAALIGAESRDIAPEIRAVAILAGLTVAHPEAADALAEVLSPTGLSTMLQLQRHCLDDGDVFQSFVMNFPSGLVIGDPATVEPFASLLAANVAGTAALPAPVLVVHSPDDWHVPVAQSEALVQRLCAAGQLAVEYRLLPGENPTSTRHLTRQHGVTWLTGLLDGATPATSC